MQIKNIIWDFDGTLMDTYPAIARTTYNVSQKNGAQVSYDDIYRLSKVTLKTALQAISNESGKTVEELFQEYLEEYPNFPASTLKVFPIVENVLQYVISNGGKNYLITNRDKESLYNHLEEHNLDIYFSDIITGSCGFPRKPDPSAFLHLKAEHKLSGKDTITVGDRFIDVEAGQQAGFAGIIYDPASYIPESKFQKVTSYAELLDLLRL